MRCDLWRNELARAVGAVWVLRAVISLELLEVQMRNFVIIPDDCRHWQRFHNRVCLESKRKVSPCEIHPVRGRLTTGHFALGLNSTDTFKNHLCMYLCTWMYVYYVCVFLSLSLLPLLYPVSF